jgi:hypothetical protein
MADSLVTAFHRHLHACGMAPSSQERYLSSVLRLIAFAGVPAGELNSQHAVVGGAGGGSAVSSETSQRMVMVQRSASARTVEGTTRLAQRNVSVLRTAPMTGRMMCRSQNRTFPAVNEG